MVPSACTGAGEASSGTAELVPLAFRREGDDSCRFVVERLLGLAAAAAAEVAVVAAAVAEGVVGHRRGTLAVGRLGSGVRLVVVTKLVVVRRPRC